MHVNFQFTGLNALLPFTHIEVSRESHLKEVALKKCKVIRTK